MAKSQGQRILQHPVLSRVEQNDISCLLFLEWSNYSIAEIHLNIHEYEIIERFGLKVSGDLFVCLFWPDEQKMRTLYLHNSVFYYFFLKYPAMFT